MSTNERGATSRDAVFDQDIMDTRETLSASVGFDSRKRPRRNVEIYVGIQAGDHGSWHTDTIPVSLNLPESLAGMAGLTLWESVAHEHYSGEMVAFSGIYYVESDEEVLDRFLDGEYGDEFLDKHADEHGDDDGALERFLFGI